MTKRTETTRALLLKAARTEFAAHGIAGARVDRIAERAGVNKQRIYANFGDKERLFQHVVGQALDELSSRDARRGHHPGRLRGTRVRLPQGQTRTTQTPALGGPALR